MDKYDLKKLEAFLKARGIKVKDGQVSVKDLPKVKEFLHDFELESGQDKEFRIGMHDWNLEEKVYRFPSNKREELMQKIKKLKGKDMSKIWDWFLEHAKRSRGMEDTDVYLDWNDPKSCMKDWEDYFSE